MNCKDACIHNYRGTFGITYIAMCTVLSISFSIFILNHSVIAFIYSFIQSFFSILSRYNMASKQLFLVIVCLLVLYHAVDAHFRLGRREELEKIREPESYESYHYPEERMTNRFQRKSNYKRGSKALSEFMKKNY